jgi:trimethylamine:corrinoid methyltransferase-like protein
LKHVKEYWYPHLYARTKKSEDLWNTEILGEKDLAVAARNKAKEILANHQLEPLEKEIQKRIKIAVANAEKRALQ